VRSDLEVLLHHAGNGRRIVTLPAGAAKTALWMLDVLDLSPLTAWHYLTCDAAFYFDCSKASRLLGWRPSVNNAEMLCEAYDWYLAHRASVDGDFGAVHTKSLEQRTLRVLKVLS
jgi:nucleoside-diphosphate-sugar epimerase